MWPGRLVITIVALIRAVTATPPESHALHEERGALPTGWVKRDRIPRDNKLSVRIGLAQRNLEHGYEYLMGVSDPTSTNYGKHWTSQQVIDVFKPSNETVEAVRTWLVDGGIATGEITHSDNKAWLAFETTVEQMEQLLHTEYYSYKDAKTRTVRPGCDSYHLPTHVRPHVDYIVPGIGLFPRKGPNARSAGKAQSARTEEGAESPGRGNGGSGWGDRWGGPLTWEPRWPFPPNGGQDGLRYCDVTVTPACIAALYKIPRTRLAAKGNSLGIYESELQFWDQLDLNLFFTNFTRWIPNGTHPINIGVDGGVPETSDPANAGGEAMLDLSNAYPIVFPQTITVFSEDDLNYQAGNSSFVGAFNDFLDSIDGSYCTYSAFGETGNAPGIDPTYPDPAPNGYKGKLQCGVYKPTNVVSFSYAAQEASMPIAYQKRQCNEFMKFGLQGISFIFASGDSGIGDYPPPYGSSGPTGCLGPKNDIFNPRWPANCPYVTAVGATKIYPGNSVFQSQPESAVYDPAGHPYAVNYSSGGGFSNVYPQPAYQKSAVATYFQDHNPPYPYYEGLAPNAPNPALPNVTALAGKTGGVYNRIGRGYPDIAANGDNIPVYVGGKYLMSGGTSSAAPIVAAIINRINEERIAIGKRPVGFLNPVLYAHPEILNDITNGSNPDCGTSGFKAVPGWEPVNGLGTPNYPKMLQVFLQLP